MTERAMLQKALWSISFYADRRRGPLPPGVNPLPVGEALEVLLENKEHRNEHLRWVLQKLSKEHIPENVQRQLLHKVGQATLPALARSAQHARDRTAMADSAQATPTCELALVCDAFHAETQDESCAFKVGPCETHIDTNTGTVDLKSESTVNKPIWQCLPMMDPRNWGKCSPNFDPECTYQIKCDSRGRPLRDRRGELIRETGTPPGEPWTGLMRERFDGQGISVENILSITFGSVSKDNKLVAVEMDYSLYGCEWIQLGLLSERGGLRKNGGGMRAIPVEGGKSTKVTVTKRVRYKDITPGNPGMFYDLGQSLNVWASVLLCARADSETVFNLCCEP